MDGSQDHDMADATAGAHANGSENGDIAQEKQRIRIVRSADERQPAILAKHARSYLVPQRQQLRLRLITKTTLWAMRCDISS